MVRAGLVQGLAPHQNSRTVIAGGILEHSEPSLLGVLAEDALGNLHADRASTGHRESHELLHDQRPANQERGGPVPERSGVAGPARDGEEA